MTTRATLIAAFVVFALSSAHADVVELRDGRTLEGSVTKDGDYLIIRHKLGEARVLRADVLSIKDTPDAWDQLEVLRKTLATGTAEERYRFACFARDNGFDDEAAQGFLAVLRVDIGHPGARAALGYVRHEGRWLTVADRNRLIGLVLHDGQWMTPKRKGELEQEARAELAARKKERQQAEAAERAAKLAKREAERDARRERIAVYELALAKERARRRAAEESSNRGSVLGGYYGNRYGYYGGATSGVYSAPVCRPIYGPSGVAGWACDTYRRTNRGFSGYSYGTSLSGTASGSNWNLNWRIGGR